jgi:hypothetical protein
MSASQEWVDVSLTRETSETDTGLTATLAASSNTQGWAAPNTQSWADDQPEETPKTEVSLLTFYSCLISCSILHRCPAAMTAFTKSIELVVVEIVMDSSVDAVVVEEITGDIAVVAASEATTVVIEAADEADLEVAEPLVPVDRTKRKLLHSGQNGGFHCHEVFIPQRYFVALTSDRSPRLLLVALLQVSCNLV